MKIEGTHIKMVRGDSETITITMRNTEGQKIDFIDSDTVYFTVKENNTTTNKMLQKVIKDFIEGTAIVSLLPEDTKGLREKDYIYDVQLTRDGNIVTTIIKPSKFTIIGDVTYE